VPGAQACGVFGETVEPGGRCEKRLPPRHRWVDPDLGVSVGDRPMPGAVGFAPSAIWPAPIQEDGAWFNGARDQVSRVTQGLADVRGDGEVISAAGPSRRCSSLPR
jgi:hypothetical protein